MSINLQFSELIQRYPQLKSCQKEVILSIEKILECFSGGGKLIAFGNGGSSADAEHFCGELQKSFILDRPLKAEVKEKIEKIDSRLALTLETGLPAFALSGMHGSQSAISNDISFEDTMAQQILALGKEGDIAVGFSTSGNSQNVVNALKVAKALNLVTISFTGEKESQCSQFSDMNIRVPETVTHKVQELHLPIYHAICMEIEKVLFS